MNMKKAVSGFFGKQLLANTEYSHSKLDEKQNSSINTFSELELTLTSYSDSIQLSCVQFYSETNLIVKPKSVSNIRGLSSSWMTSPSNLLVLQSGYWKDDNYCAHKKSILRFKFDDHVQVSYYEMWTSPTDPEADPSSALLRGFSLTSNKWEILDRRNILRIPTGREESYGVLKFNFGKQENIKSQIDNTGHLAQKDIRLFSSCELSNLWSKERDIISEYLPIKEKIDINYEYMSFTKMKESLDFFMDYNPPILNQKFSQQLTKYIRVGFEIPDMKVMYFCETINGETINYKNAILNLYETFSWRSKIIFSLLEYTFKEKKEKLKYCITELAKISNLYKSKQIEVFHSIVSTIYYDSCDNDKDPIKNHFYNFLDNYKLDAFRSSFIEPSKFYYFCVQNIEKQQECDLHCSSFYSGLLLSTLGIRIPTMPYFLDQVCCCPPFLRIERKEINLVFEEMINNLGKPWEDIEECNSRIIYNLGILPDNIISQNDITAVDLVNRAIDISDDNQFLRNEIAFYLDRYATCFMKEKIFEPLFNWMKQINEFENVFKELCEELEIEELTLDEWIYENNVFNLEKAERIFKKINVV